MFDSLFQTVINGDVTVTTYLACLGAALACGVMITLCAVFRAKPTRSYLLCLLLLPPIVATVITMVNGNIGTGLAVAGAFSLVRFRSVAGKAKDIACIFAAMTAGLTAAAGYLALVLLFTVIICGVTVLFTFVPMGREKALHLHITVPESLCYADAFNDLFEEYTKQNRLTKVKTAHMGSLYKLQYEIEMKDGTKMQEFMDKLRCRNGNLEIMIADAVTEGSEEL